LVANLADGKMSDSEYIRIFLLTHRHFMASDDLLQRLIARYVLFG